ncbi:MAG: formyltransferase family protein [Pelagibacteraceae bacterium]|jgi:methionyl-tRNA formyltransferase|nr:formyltransferase family protein [Pelagibacteraceae bacterium]MDP6710168.1 formyltransferase family protein [Pelagibacteraceae bacterium]|tara:strand:- start:7879 stop:8646 length:768 start_codon:yes stop_codon:yes gene_type:complete
MYICIAGKNKCAIHALKFLFSNKNKELKILALPNHNDKGTDDWQPSFRKFAIDNKIRIAKIEELYSIKELFFFSLEYLKIIKVKEFKTNNLFNFHFSLLPKYRGCHTNFLQIYNGEKYSGVTIHKIDSGIDTGDIIDQKKFKIKINDTAQENYLKLMNLAIVMFKKNLHNILNSKYKLKKQVLNSGCYYSRDSVNYKKMLKITLKKSSIKIHNKIRSLIFPAYQLPKVNGMEVQKSVYKNNKIYLIENNNKKYKY